MTLLPIRRRRRSVAFVTVSLIAALAAGGCGQTAAVGYDLPPERAQYTFTVDRDNIQTEWEFWSSLVTEDETPEGYVCAEWIHAQTHGDVPPPCRAEPLIFLRYEADLGLDNSVAEPGSGQVKVTAYYQADEAPVVAGLELWFSVDGGDHWKSVPVRRHANEEGVFIGQIVYPKFADTIGSVSLKAEAWDDEGNRVEQIVDEAWFLREVGVSSKGGG